MPAADILFAFFVTSAIFAFVPGPAMLYAAAQTLARGRRPGLMAALGIHLGGYAHVLAAAAGLSALFHAVPPLYLAVKIAGAVYLVYLGIRLFRGRGEGAAAGTGDAADAATAVAVRSGRRAFAESVAVEVLNPKTALFFLAFLPQFTDPAAGLPIWAQIAVLGAVVNLMFSAADVVCVLAAGAMMDRLRRPGRLQRGLQRAGGAVLVGLGVNLALQRG
ncbi:LysE family translocator [Methylobrevis pamukkalensis]|uniref:Homoserine/homoserine lactone efflux protein n=1 Tax=Methylobrevis pamukkalensis TaxID=1439726 RepID=A0A1E3GXH8_9HYPH|nr:LysE family translocator [Methylobrevis pamukkalensis]ODN68760.1 Homoserine/homoserine lactone efflux protein [Methylobrevis pamukkalensis]